MLHEVRVRFGVKSYMRCKDDMLVIIDGAYGNVPAFYRELQVKAACLKLKVDSISRQSAEMLDLIVYKGNGWLQHGMLGCHVRIRHSAIGIT